MTRKLVSLLAVGLIVLSGCAQKADTTNLDISASEGGSQIPVDPNKVINYLKGAGLPIGRIDAYNADTDPYTLAGRPDRYSAMVVFVDDRFQDNPVLQNGQAVACKKLVVVAWDECGGTVQVFNSASDLRKWKAAIVLAREQTPGAPPEYRYEKNLSLLRLGHVLTPEQAKAYENAYNSFPG
jgi:hypothetical protein